MKRSVKKALVSLLLSGLVFATKTDLLAAPGEVIITHASMSTSAIPLWVAQRQNFFGKYGVKSKVVWVRSNPAQIATLASGDTQIAYGGGHDSSRRCGGRQRITDGSQLEQPRKLRSRR
ncbi:MAG TPA: hypothetical protein VGA01_11785 [Candidatus Binatia bacterium]